MPFCKACETYLPPDTTTCPHCGTPRPPAPEREPAWTAMLDAPPLGRPQVAGDALLLPAQAGAPGGVDNQHSALHAFNLTDGAPLWPEPLKFDYALISGLAVLPESTDLLALVATAGTHLIHGSGALLALDAAGQVRWRWPEAPDVRRVSAPALAGEQVCVAADAHTLVLVDLADGAKKATLALDCSASQCAPAVAGDVAYVPCRGPHLLAMELPKGATRWHYSLQTDAPARTWLDPTPLLLGPHLFTATSTGAVLALDARDGTLIWQVAVGPAGKRLSPLTTDGTRLFVGARDGLHALDLADGHELWVYPTGRRIEAAPVVLGGVVYVACRDHHLYALDAASGRECWRQEVERRIEHAPVIIPHTPSAEPWAVIVDRGGTLTALRRPLSAAEYEAAEDWVAAAAAHADRGRPAQGAKLLEEHDEPLKAAELWKAAGELERAALDYETAGAWQDAAELWREIGRPFKYATALEAYARALSEQVCENEKRAEAWDTATQAWTIVGKRKRIATCQREVARYRRLPLIYLAVQPEDLELDAWSRLQFTVRNEGFGPARTLIIRAVDDKFEGQIVATHRIVTLDAGNERTDWLTICPHAHGNSVPLRLRVEYQDHRGQIHTFEETLYLPVARELGHNIYIKTEGGPVVMRDVITEGGDFVGRDKHLSDASSKQETPDVPL